MGRSGNRSLDEKPAYSNGRYVYYYLRILLELAASIEFSGVDKLCRGTLIKIGGRHMNLYIGTSGYSYKEWKGRFLSR